MKNIITLLAAVFLLVSCKKEEVKDANDVINEAKETTAVVAKEGSGKITLTCNGKELVAEGACGALVSMGELMVAVKDKTNPTKVFTINFNGEDFPENGKEYVIKPIDYTSDNRPENEVSVSFMEGLPNNKMNVWDPQAGSGKVVFAVNGNEIKCTLKDIKLQPSTAFNADDLQKEGTVSGELTIYKN